MRVAVVGGGFGGAYAIRSLQRALPKAQIVLFEPRSRFVFTPLLHEVAAGVLHEDAVTHVYGDMFRRTVRHVRMRARTVDLARKRVITQDGKSHPFDYVVIAPGSRSADPPKGARVHTLKSVEDALMIKRALERSVEQLSRTRRPREGAKAQLRCVVVGGGPTGIELAAELSDFCAYLLRKEGLVHEAEAAVTLIQSREHLLPGADARLREVVRKRLARKGIEVITSARVTRVTRGALLADMGDRTRSVSASLVVWAAGVVPNEVGILGAAKEDGRIPVESTLQVRGFPFAFAIGDASRVRERPLPDLAQVASQQGMHAGKAIARLARGMQAHAFVYRGKGFLLSLGQGYGAGRIGSVLVKGIPAWLVWRTVYLAKFLGARSKMRMAAEYTLRLFCRDA